MSLRLCHDGAASGPRPPRRPTLRRKALAALGVAALLLPLAPGCGGGRTGLDELPPLPPRPPCRVDSDCRGFADHCKPVLCQPFAADAGMPEGGGTCVPQPPVVCDDNDPCTADSCDPTDGTCSYRYLTQDNDGDGYRGPLPGFAAGAPGSCGNDCNDANPAVHPGAPEICDGLDNDCDGIADEGAVYVPSGLDVQVDEAHAPAEPGGLAWSGTSYAATYTGLGDTQGFDVFLSPLDPNGHKVTPPGETQITLTNADGAGGPIVWVGNRYGLTWSDRRSGDYEIYFSLLNAEATKGIPDARLTFAPGFSLNPAMVWNGSEFLIVWQDDRQGNFNILAQRVDIDGSVIGSNLPLTEAPARAFGNESPNLAVGVKGVGVTWSQGDALTHYVTFQVFSPDFSKPLTPAMNLTDGTTAAVGPTVIWNRDRYTVAWFDKTASPAAIYATSVREDGTMVTPPTVLTAPGAFHSRYPNLWPLGDRFLMAYSDDRDQNDGYELYTRTVKADLTPEDAELRITHASHDSLFPMIDFGPMGNLAILFRDDRVNGDHHVFLTPLKCTMPGGPHGP